MEVGYLAKPVNPNGKGVILIHEFWGLNQQIRGVAGRLAKEGFTALAADLYEGKVTADPAEAGKLHKDLDIAKSLEILKAALSELAKLQISPSRVAIWGFCMGGRVSFEAARNNIGAGAYVIYYGRITDDKTVLATVQKPVLGVFGGLDKGITKDLVLSFKKALEELGKTSEIYIYDDADHAFFNEDRPVYNTKAAQDAWEKTITFLNKYL